MSVENPTGDAGASITDRLEAFLGAGDPPEEKQTSAAPEASDSSSDADDAPPDANAQNQDDAPAGDGQGDDEGPQLTTADLANMFGVDESTLDVDADGNAVVKTKIDGKDGAAKLTDILKSYQLQGHVDNKAREVAAQQQALQHQAQQADQQVRQRLEQLDQVIGLASAELNREFQSVDWNNLRATDPGEYSAQLADFQARQQQLNSTAQRAEQERATLQSKHAEQERAFTAQERERLPTLIPEWKDQAVASKEQREILEWGQKAGFELGQLNNITSAAAVVAMRKAMLYDRLQSSKAAVEGKVRAAPKLVKAGQAPQVSREQNNVRTLKQNIRNSGGKMDAVAAFLLATGKA